MVVVHLCQGIARRMQGLSRPQRAAPRPLSEEEKLAAQGVPPEIIASMRSFNALAFSRPAPQVRQQQCGALTPLQGFWASLVTCSCSGQGHLVDGASNERSIAK